MQKPESGWKPPRTEGRHLRWSDFGDMRQGWLASRLPGPLLKVCGYYLGPPKSSGYYWLNSVLILGEQTWERGWRQGIRGLYLEWETVARSRRA